MLLCFGYSDACSDVYSDAGGEVLFWGVFAGFEGAVDFAEHVVYEGRAVGVFGAGIDGVVIGGLGGMNHVFNGEVLKDGVPTAEDERLPEAAHASVAVGKGVYELELVMEDAAFDEGVVGGFFQPCAQVVNEGGDAGGGGRHVDDARAVHDADAGLAEVAGGGNERGHHDFVRFEQVGDGKGVEFGIEVVGGDGVFDFLDLAERGDDGFAIENVGDLLLGERVALDGE